MLSVPYHHPPWTAAEWALVEACGDGREVEGRDGVLIAALRAATPGAEDAAVVATSSGRTALRLLLRVMARGRPGRRRVIVPTYACKGVLDPVLEAGLVPVLVDCGPDLLADVDDILAVLDDRVLACLLVHTGGKRLVDEALIAHARALDVFTVSDECQSLGSARLFAAAECPADFDLASFAAGKSARATAGGALVARVLQDEVEAEARSLGHEDGATVRARSRAVLETDGGDPGRLAQVRFDRMSPYRDAGISRLDAALAASQVRRLPELNAARMANAARLARVMARYPAVFRFPGPERNAWSGLAVILPDRRVKARFRAAMMRAGIQLEPGYVPLHLRDFGLAPATHPLPLSEAFHGGACLVPAQAGLDEERLRLVEEALRRFGEAETARA